MRAMVLRNEFSGYTANSLRWGERDRGGQPRYIYGHLCHAHVCPCGFDVIAHGAYMMMVHGMDDMSP